MAENKEGLFINGRVNAKNEYQGEKRTTYTLDIVIIGLRNLIPVRVSPEVYHKCEPGQPFNHPVLYASGKYGSSFTLA